jgi:unspecific peroxygenase
MQKFEGDTSLSRNDYFLANGDDYSFNGTLFSYMQDTCKGNFDRDNLALYRHQRYQQSLADNGNFYFGPKSLLLYGAASFLYELFSSGGNAGTPDLPTMKSFFGAAEDDKGGYTFNNQEQTPPDWYNRRKAYTLADVNIEINALYLKHPVLFGGNVGRGKFNALASFGSIKNGTLDTSGSNTLCLIYQLATDNVPSSVSSTVLELPLGVVGWAAGKLNPVYKNFGCPLKLI